jgi:class 3 adenylate cyclase/tetratricopeptide (TPR) repeat protein
MTPHASLEEWLAHFGLSRLEAIFRDNGIDLDILASLTDDDLRKLGFSFGDRRRVLTAVLATVAPAASAVPQPAAPAEAERRQLTVLFCDLAGSTALSARLDPEDLREVIRAYQETCAAVITRHDGFVAKFMGDGLLAYFGYPRAHEDEAERTVRAALDIVASVGGLQTPAREALQVRIGIATGLVVVGDLIGMGAAQEQSVVGETPNLAARLQALAGPNAVVIGEATRRQVGGLFDLRDLGVQTLKGFAAAQRAWQVLGESNVASRFEALHPAATALVGRDEEIDLLLRRWARAKDSAGQVVLLSGEPGIGKSRIAAVLQDRLRDEPHITLRYFGSPHHRDSPLQPFIAHLEGAAGIAREDLPETRLVKLEAQLLQSEESPAETFAVLADLLNLPTEGGHSAPSVGPQRKRELTFAALLQQLDRLSQREPVLMLFEDVHWIDPTSCDLLGQIVEQVPRLRLLLVVTARPEFRAPWSSAAHVTVLALSRLGAREGRALADLVAGSKRLPDEIVSQIVERADGVPLFVEELTKTVLESGLLREQNGRFVSDGALPPLAVPTSLHGSLMARLDRLGPAKQIAQIGAAIGRQFSHELVAAVARLREAQLGEALDQLVGSELVFRRGLPPRADYVFKHALVQDAAYSTLLRTRRQELHARIAAVLEVGHSIAPEMLAHHFGEAGEAEKAAHHWLEAGRRALRRSGNTEAITHLTKGLGALTGLPKSEEADRSELEIQLSLGPVLSATRGWSAPEAERAYRRAEVLARGLGADRERFDAVWGLWMIHNTGNAPDVAHGITGELFQIADRLNDPALRMEAHHAAWACDYTLGDHAATIEHMRRGLAIYESEKHGAHAFSYGGHDTAVCGRAIGGMSLWVLGYPDQAIRSTDAAIALAESMGHAPSVAHALLFASQCHLYCRDALIVLGMTDRLITLASEHRLMLYHAIGGIAHGWARAHQGQLDKGLAELRRNLESYDSDDKPKAYSMSSRMALAEIYLKAREDVQALNAVDSALRAGERSGSQTWLAAALHIKGKALASMASARWPDAETCFMEALQVARTQQAKSLELRAATGLARLWCIEGRRADARALLAPVYYWFTEGFDTADLKDAKALLAELA